MTKWNNLSDIYPVSVRKVISEFRVSAIGYTPYGYFRVKVYEQPNGSFIGFGNLQLSDKVGGFCGPVGYGDTPDEALEDTIKQYFLLLNGKKDIDMVEGVDFEYYDHTDF